MSKYQYYFYLGIKRTKFGRKAIGVKMIKYIKTSMKFFTNKADYEEMNYLTTANLKIMLTMLVIFIMSELLTIVGVIK